VEDSLLAVRLPTGRAARAAAVAGLFLAGAGLGSALCWFLWGPYLGTVLAAMWVSALTVPAAVGLLPPRERGTGDDVPTG